MILYKQLNKEKQTYLTLQAQRFQTIIPIEKTGSVLTNEMKRMRSNWLSCKSN